MTYTAYRDIDVMADGRFVVASFEVRYRFTINAGRKAVTWANATGGFSPEEKPTVDVTEVAVRWHPKHKWKVIDGMAQDMVLADITDDWFIEQAMEGAE